MFFSKKKKQQKNIDLELPKDLTVERSHGLVASGMTINGDVKFAGTLRVDGRVDGRVHLQENKKGTLVLSQDGTVNGPVAATELITDGMINGNVKIYGRVELRPNARIRGELHYQTITIHEGAIIEGRCVQMDDDVKPPQVSQQPKSNTRGRRRKLASTTTTTSPDGAPVTFLRKES